MPRSKLINVEVAFIEIPAKEMEQREQALLRVLADRTIQTKGKR